MDRTEQVGLDPKTTADFPAAKIVSRVEILASGVFLERTCAGHEPRTMRLLGRRRHLLIEIRSRDDATLVRCGASTTELLRLVNVGPFFKAFGTAICQEIYISANLLQFKLSRDGIDFELY